MLRTSFAALCLALCITLISTPANARSYAGRAENALRLVDAVIAEMLEAGDSFGLAVDDISIELLRLQADMTTEGHIHSGLDEAVELATTLAKSASWDSGSDVEYVAQLGLLHILLTEVSQDFQAGLLTDEVRELPVTSNQTVFDTGVRNWLPFSGTQSEISEGAVFTDWDNNAKFVMVSSGGEIMLNIENNNYTAQWLLAVPFSSSISFGIERGNPEHILISVHVPDASTHFLIDKGGTGQLYIHRR